MGFTFSGYTSLFNRHKTQTSLSNVKLEYRKRKINCFFYLKQLRQGMTTFIVLIDWKKLPYNYIMSPEYLAVTFQIIQ